MGLLSTKWIRLLEGLRADEPLHIARCYFQSALYFTWILRCVTESLCSGCLFM